MVNFFKKKHSEVYTKVREEAVFVFEKDLEMCNFIGNSILDQFQVETSVSNTLKKLKTEAFLQQKSGLSESRYNKMLCKVAEEVKQRYLK